MNNWLKVPMESEIEQDVNGYFVNQKKQELLDHEILVKKRMSQGGTSEEFQLMELEKQAFTAAAEILDTIWDKIQNPNNRRNNYEL